jgi:hypothetical protein
MARWYVQEHLKLNIPSLTYIKDAHYEYEYPVNYTMIPRKEEPLPLFPQRTTISRPSSEATEIFEDEDCYDESPMQSVSSVSGRLSVSLFSSHIDDSLLDSSGPEVSLPRRPRTR